MITIANQLRILNCLTSKQPERDWTLSDAFDAGVLPLQPPPPSWDLRRNWWDIGDQGQTGACVGWASADGVFRWHFVTSGLLASNQRLSVRFTWMAAKEVDDDQTRATTFLEQAGTSIKAALDVARKYGCAHESLLPLTGGLSVLPENSFYSSVAGRRISRYFNLVADATDKLSNFREWIAKGGPVLTRLTVDKSWIEIKCDGKLERYLGPEPNGGHAVALVGYTPEYFIVRNSYGTCWGQGGFAFASNEYAQAAFTEAYGVTV